jgi:hypothetical protein
MGLRSRLGRSRYLAGPGALRFTCILWTSHDDPPNPAGVGLPIHVLRASRRYVAAWTTGPAACSPAVCASYWSARAPPCFSEPTPRTRPNPPLVRPSAEDEAEIRAELAELDRGEGLELTADEPHRRRNRLSEHVLGAAPGHVESLLQQLAYQR